MRVFWSKEYQKLTLLWQLKVKAAFVPYNIFPIRSPSYMFLNLLTLLTFINTLRYKGLPKWKNPPLHKSF